MNKRVTFNMRELKRLYVIQQVAEQKMTGEQAAQHLELSIRQVRRLAAKFRAQGAPGLVHGNRGRTAHNRVDEAVQVKIQELAEGEYKDYNDSHFTEELSSGSQDEFLGVKSSRARLRLLELEREKDPPAYGQAKIDD